MDAFQQKSTCILWDLEDIYWHKVQLCFFILKEALVPYVEEVSEALHMELTSLCQNCDLCEIDDSNRNLTSLCKNCEEKWKTEIERFASMGYKIDWQNKDIFMKPEKHWSVAKCFVTYDQKNKRSASACDINALLTFIVNCTKFAEERFGDFQINAKKVHDDRNRDIHRGITQISYGTLQDYKNNMVNLLKNRKLKAAGREDDAVRFIEKVCGDNYILSREDVRKAEFSALEGKMELTHHTLVSKFDRVEKEFQLLNSEIRELDEEKVDLNNLSETCKKMIQHFEEVSSIDYNLSSEEVLKAKFAALEGHMELTLFELSNFDSQYQSAEKEIEMLRRKLGELEKQKEETSDLKELNDMYKKVMEIANGTDVDRQHIEDGLNQAENQIHEMKGQLEEVKAQKELENCRLLLIKAYKSKETISLSPLLDTGIDLQDLYTDINMTVVEKRNKEKSQNVSLSEIFRKADKVTRVVLQGAAGFGKSTSGRKLLSDWCCADRMLRFDLLLYLDVKKVSSESNLLDAFFNQFPLIEQTKQEEDHPYKQYFVSLITQAEDNKVLLILDGLDDMTTSITFIEQIMRRELYPSMTVLALTCPWKIEQMQLNQPAHIDLLLDLKGFSFENSQKFAQKILVSCCSGQENFDIGSFFKEVNKNDVIKSLIHIPLLLLFLVCLWCEDNKMTFPKTIHELYLEMFNMLVKRGMKHKIKLQNKEGPDEKKQKSQPFENAAFSSLPKIKDMLLVKQFGEDFLNGLCDVAYHILLKDKNVNSHVFQEDELVELLGTDGESKLQTALKLGVLSKSESPSGLTIKTTVSFLHKTVQEFLAAIRICCSQDRFDTFLSTLKTVDVLKNETVIMFTAGISRSHCTKISEKICKIVDRNTPFSIAYSICRLYIDCAREAPVTKNWLSMQYLSAISVEELNVLVSVLRSVEDVRKIELGSLRLGKTMDISQLYPHMYPHLSEIHLTNVMVNDATLGFYGSTCLTKLILHGATLRGKSKLILSKCDQLKRVFLRYVKGTNESEIVLSECRNLEELYVRNSENDATCTLDLSESTSLTQFTLIDFTVSTKSKLVMPKLPHLGKLVLHNVSLENWIVESNCLTELILAYVTLTNGSKLILPELTKLKSILACNISIDTSVLDLSGSTSLTKVVLSNVKLNSDGQMMLSGCQQLTHLKLNNLSLTNFSLDLTESSSLTELILSNITGPVKMIMSRCTKWRLLELKSVHLKDIVLQDPGTIHLSSCSISNVKMSVNWTQNLLECVNLKTITIQHVNMGDARLDLSVCTCLTDLTLIDLTITSDGMRHLFESLSSCKQLESLTLCKLDLYKIPLENDMLERLKSLTCFSLVNLGKTLDLSKCTCLKYLELVEVTMAGDGMALFENMSHCSHLERLKLDCLDLTNTLLEMDTFTRFKLLFMTNITVSSQCATQIQNDPEIGSCLTVEEGLDMVRYVVNYLGGSEYDEYHDYVDEPYPYTDEEVIDNELYEETGEMFLDFME